MNNEWYNHTATWVFNEKYEKFQELIPKALEILGGKDVLVDKVHENELKSLYKYAISFENREISDLEKLAYCKYFDKKVTGCCDGVSEDLFWLATKHGMGKLFNNEIKKYLIDIKCLPLIIKNPLDVCSEEDLTSLRELVLGFIGDEIEYNNNRKNELGVVEERLELSKSYKENYVNSIVEYLVVECLFSIKGLSEAKYKKDNSIYDKVSDTYISEEEISVINKIIEELIVNRASKVPIRVNPSSIYKVYDFETARIILHVIDSTEVGDYLFKTDEDRLFNEYNGYEILLKSFKTEEYFDKKIREDNMRQKACDREYYEYDREYCEYVREVNKKYYKALRMYND